MNSVQGENPGNAGHVDTVRIVANLISDEECAVLLEQVFEENIHAVTGRPDQLGMYRASTQHGLNLGGLSRWVATANVGAGGISYFGGRRRGLRVVDGKIHLPDFTGRLELIIEPARSCPNKKVRRDAWFGRLNEDLVVAPLDFESRAPRRHGDYRLANFNHRQMVERRVDRHNAVAAGRRRLNPLCP